MNNAPVTEEAIRQTLEVLNNACSIITTLRDRVLMLEEANDGYQMSAADASAERNDLQGQLDAYQLRNADLAGLNVDLQQHLDEMKRLYTEKCRDWGRVVDEHHQMRQQLGAKDAEIAAIKSSIGYGTMLMLRDEIEALRAEIARLRNQFVYDNEMVVDTD